MMPPVFKLAIICGGPSLERGISLNSARSVMDHVASSSIEVIPIYVDVHKRFYRISPSQLYSNTPADFDYKLDETAAKMDLSALQTVLSSAHLVFPLIHGAFGEDGELQELLESLQVPFIGHSSACCRKMFVKYQAAYTLKEHGFYTLPQMVFFGRVSKKQVEGFFREHHLQRAIVKPSVGGSSIGVSSVRNAQEAYEKLQEIFSRNLSSSAILEPFCEGKEFTVVVFENKQREPVALIPTEVELSYEENAIFDYRKKYLPTNQAAYHTPARFPSHVIEQIRRDAEKIFQLFNMSSFVRLDGWILENGKICFTDINPISGLEQNSFFFRQASLVGMTHGEALTYILEQACHRYGLRFPEKLTKICSKKPLYVLFGNKNAERQVSLMTGTNVWLKLLQSQKYAPTPFFFDGEGSVWKIPYSFALNHTVEEIRANCATSQAEGSGCEKLVQEIRIRLEMKEGDVPSAASEMSLNAFLEHARSCDAFVFLGLHGEEGEDGRLQRLLEEYQIPFNGSSSAVSALCMDKFLTGQVVDGLRDPEISSLPKKSISLSKYVPGNCDEKLWDRWCRELSSKCLIIKPRSDGCSAGIVLLQSCEDFSRYCTLYHEKKQWIPPFSFANQNGPVEMPSSLHAEYILEPYIETDLILFEEEKTVTVVLKEGWVELTVGILEHEGNYHSLNPSITVVEGAILSLEEKFQGGTGINLTPPPPHVISLSATQKIKDLVERAARGIGIRNYARMDIFFNRLTEKMIVIEVNTLPALTASTVIYHQALAETPPLAPLQLLETIISFADATQRGKRVLK